MPAVPLRSTACNKELQFITPVCPTTNKDWETKKLHDWNSEDVMYWILYIADSNNEDSDNIAISKFKDVSGTTLSNMTEAEFLCKIPKFGSILYKSIKELLNNNQENDRRKSLRSTAVNKSLSFFDSSTSRNAEWKDKHVKLWEPRDVMFWILSIARQRGWEAENVNLLGFRDVDGTLLWIMTQDAFVQREPHYGKQICEALRKKKNKGGEKLWEYIRDLLCNPKYNPSHIEWVDYEKGIFKFIETAKVAEIWGKRRKVDEESKMSYENFTRAMRYYYTKGKFQSIVEKRVYQFGIDVTWKDAKLSSH